MEKFHVQQFILFGKKLLFSMIETTYFTKKVCIFLSSSVQTEEIIYDVCFLKTPRGMQIADT